MQTQKLIAPTIALFVTILLLAAVTMIDVDWTQFTPATCMPIWCFCEGIRDGFLRQPSNTWSNLGFVYVGYLILWDVLRVPSTAVSRDSELATAFRVAFGITTAFIGFGSWIYHASLTFFGQWFDVVAMYLLPTLVLLFHAQRHSRIGPQRAVALYVVVNFTLGMLLIVVPEMRRYLFGLSLLAAAVVEIGSRRSGTGTRDLRYFLGSCAALGAAFGIWILDITHTLCVPDSLLQGHAAWHLLCATSAAFLYLYFRSERVPD